MGHWHTRRVEHWDLIAAERRALADLLETFSDEEWATLTLCTAWTVKDMAAHVMVGPTVSMPELAGAMVRARFSLDGAIERMTATRARHTREELIATIRRHAESRFTPPTFDWHAPLSEIVIHREDIVIPLGLPSDRPVETWRHVLDFLVSDTARRAFVKGRLPGVRLEPTDLDWAHGSGPEVTGPAAALGTAIAGRAAVLDRLSGPGKEELAAWMRG